MILFLTYKEIKGKLFWFSPFFAKFALHVFLSSLLLHGILFVGSLSKELPDVKAARIFSLDDNILLIFNYLK